MLYKGHVIFNVQFEDIQLIGHPLAPLFIKNMCAKQLEANVQCQMNYTKKNSIDSRFKVYWGTYFDKKNKPNNNSENEELINLKTIVENGEFTLRGKEAVKTFPKYFHSIVEEGLLNGKSIDDLWEEFYTNTKEWCEIKSMEIENLDENEK